MTKGVTKTVIRGVTKTVTRTAPAIQQLAHKRLRLGLELSTPVAERLQRQTFGLTIFPLIQVTAFPCLMMRPPEVFTVSRPGRGFVSHIALLSFKT